MQGHKPRKGGKQWLPKGHDILALLLSRLKHFAAKNADECKKPISRIKHLRLRIEEIALLVWLLAAVAKCCSMT